MTGGIRRTYVVDRFGYKSWSSGDGGHTFNQTTSPWRDSSGVGSWYVYNNSIGSPDTDISYLYMSTPATGSTFLSNTQQVTGQERISLDWGIDYNTTNPSGVYFMSDTGSLDRNSYRVKQNLLHNKVMVEKMTGAGSAQFLGSFSYAEGAGINYYRVRYFPQDYKIESDVTLQEIAGRFILYAGATYNSMTNIGSFTDPTPLTNGSYHGYFIGANGSPDLYLYTYADDFWPMPQRIKTHHSLRGPSSAWMWTPKFYFEKWAKWKKNEYVQVFYSEEQGNTVVTEELDFFGSLESIRQFGKDSIICIFHAPNQRSHQQHQSYGPFTGLSTGRTGYTGEFLPQFGGEAYAQPTSYYGPYVTGENTKLGTISLTGRADDGVSDLDIVKKMCLVEDYYNFYTPETQWFITNKWRDKTSTIIDCGSYDSRFLDYDEVEDLTQTTTSANVFYDIGSSATYNNDSDTTGSRSGLHGLHIDLHVGDSVEAQSIGSTLVHRYGPDTYCLDLYFMARYTFLRPGDMVSLSMPHVQLGGDYSEDHANWVPVTASVIAKDVDTSNNVVHLRVNGTYNTRGVVVGHQRDQSYFSDMLTKNYGKTMSANANHL